MFTGRCWLGVLLLTACDPAIRPDGGTGDPDGGIAPARAAPWTDASVSIDVVSYSYWVGSSHYAKSRDELTPAQLAAVEGFEIVLPSKQPAYDMLFHTITITDDDGGARLYRSAQFDTVDGDETAAERSRPTISAGSFYPFWSTFDCATSRTRGVPPWPISTDPGCENYRDLRNCSAPLKFDVAVASHHAVTGWGSGVPLQARLSVLDGGVVAESGPPLDGGAFLVGSWLDAGVYALDVECAGPTTGASAVLVIRFLR